MTRVLVCEGDCNGGAVALYDTAVRNAGRMDCVGANGEIKTTSTVADSWLTLARTFLHTPVCAQGDADRLCGAVRRG